MHAWLALALAIVAEVIATTALKISDGFHKPWPSLVVVLGYGVSFWFLSLTLKRISMGMAYAVWSGAGTVLITLIGLWLFRQKLDWTGMLGIGLIVAGVLVLNLASRSTLH